jgi:hypothetical protein
MWVAVLPLAVLFIRQLGWPAARRWLIPPAVVSLILLVAPLVRSPSAYINGPIKMNLAKGASDSVAHASIYIVSVTLVILIVGTFFVRSLAATWGVVAAALAAMLLTIFLCRLPEMTALQSYRHYETLWYQGWVFVFALAALLCPLTDRVDRQPAE